ncbi:hypothetical protein L1I30_05040 [Gillisia sp. M10.2A]|uniref:Polyprenyl synthetase n=1 Tax=Gillisia lutea TaxID=2909668 RepID=A0ABS9EDU6_9FLAO|nr:hypothetical protein [Gillisia lutea]MCF4101021.1 hypothetical protein [Gillisia lutea]
MKNSFRNFIELPGTYLFLLTQVWKQNVFNKKYLLPEIGLFEPSNDGSVSKEDIKKITDYYALGVSAVLGTSFCVLRGSKMKLPERKSLSYLGGISGLLDDLFDDTTKEASNLEELILKPKEMHPNTTHEALLLQLYTKGLQYVSCSKKVQQQALNVFSAQKESLKQKDASIFTSELKKLTLKKGGTSFLYYRYCLENSPNEAEEKLIYHLGGLMQLGNDIFDVWKDHQDKITTLATNTSNIQELRNYFHSQLNKTFELAAFCDYPSKNREKFLRIISLGIARVFVGLDQFERLQHLSKGEFCIEKFSRRELICDMQKPKNQLKAIQYYFKILNENHIRLPRAK